uniref:Uncharacterized protein n=1 Tax=Musca domestica TaxID=7370 RepID=A0A1I8M8M9_MUSDO
MTGGGSRHQLQLKDFPGIQEEDEHLTAAATATATYDDYPLLYLHIMCTMLENYDLLEEGGSGRSNRQSDDAGDGDKDDGIDDDVDEMHQHQSTSSPSSSSTQQQLLENAGDDGEISQQQIKDMKGSVMYAIDRLDNHNNNDVHDDDDAEADDDAVKTYHNVTKPTNSPDHQPAISIIINAVAAAAGDNPLFGLGRNETFKIMDISRNYMGITNETRGINNTEGWGSPRMTTDNKKDFPKDHNIKQMPQASNMEMPMNEMKHYNNNNNNTMVTEITTKNTMPTILQSNDYPLRDRILGDEPSEESEVKNDGKYLKKVEQNNLAGYGVNKTLISGHTLSGQGHEEKIKNKATKGGPLEKKNMANENFTLKKKELSSQDLNNSKDTSGYRKSGTLDRNVLENIENNEDVNLTGYGVNKTFIKGHKFYGQGQEQQIENKGGPLAKENLKNENSTLKGVGFTPHVLSNKKDTPEAQDRKSEAQDSNVLENIENNEDVNLTGYGVNKTLIKGYTNSGQEHEEQIENKTNKGGPLAKENLKNENFTLKGDGFTPGYRKSEAQDRNVLENIENNDDVNFTGYGVNKTFIKGHKFYGQGHEEKIENKTNKGGPLAKEYIANRNGTLKREELTSHDLNSNKDTQGYKNSKKQEKNVLENIDDVNLTGYGVNKSIIKGNTFSGQGHEDQIENETTEGVSLDKWIGVIHFQDFVAKKDTQKTKVKISKSNSNVLEEQIIKPYNRENDEFIIPTKEREEMLPQDPKDITSYGNSEGDIDFPSISDTRNSTKSQIMAEEKNQNQLQVQGSLSPLDLPIQKDNLGNKNTNFKLDSANLDEPPNLASNETKNNSPIKETITSQDMVDQKDTHVTKINTPKSHSNFWDEQMIDSLKRENEVFLVYENKGREINSHYSKDTLMSDNNSSPSLEIRNSTELPGTVQERHERNSPVKAILTPQEPGNKKDTFEIKNKNLEFHSGTLEEIRGTITSPDLVASQGTITKNSKPHFKILQEIQDKNPPKNNSPEEGIMAFEDSRNRKDPQKAQIKNSKLNSPILRELQDRPSQDLFKKKSTHKTKTKNSKSKSQTLENTSKYTRILPQHSLHHLNYFQRHSIFSSPLPADVMEHLISLRNSSIFTNTLSSPAARQQFYQEFYHNYDIPLGYLRYLCKRITLNKSQDNVTVSKHPTGNGTHNTDGSVISTTTQPDSGYIALIVIGSLLGTSLVLGVLLYSGYRYCSRRSINSMNFENPVYRKTTEDHFSLEKNLPVRMYPSTVDEESKEPLNEQGTECV